MDYELINVLVSGLAVLAVWLILRPQQVENQALHQSIDDNTRALKELTNLINELRIEQASTEAQITNLWHRYKELKDEVDLLKTVKEKAIRHE